MRFLKHKAILYKKPGLKMSKEIMANVKKAMKEMDLGTEICVVNVETREGAELLKKNDIPEVPCFVLGKSYYFSDTMLSYNRFKEVLVKWSR